jgi:hypothetical protein
MNKFDIKYVYIFFLIFIFFIYGLTLSEIIDFIFPDYDKKNEEYRLFIEIIGEIGVAYLIYYTFKNYSELLVKKLFKNISKTPPYYLNQLLLISFSTGIFQHLQKSSYKVNHMKEKYLNIDFIKKYMIKKH